MKLYIFVVLAVISYANVAASVQNEFDYLDYIFAFVRTEDGRTAQVGPQEMLNHVISEVESEHDQALPTGQLEKAQGRNIVAGAIQNALEDFRDVVVNGNPTLDPLIIEQIGPFEFSATGLRVTGHVYNFHMDGLRWYLVNHVTFNALRLALGVRVTVPWLTFTGRYGAAARIALLSHEAGGNYRVFINRLETTLDVRVGPNIMAGGTLLLRELDILIVIHDINIQINGMVGSSLLNNLINSFVQNAAQNLLRDELEGFSKLLSRELFDTVNDFLGNFTLDDLFG